MLRTVELRREDAADQHMTDVERVERQHYPSWDAFLQNHPGAHFAQRFEWRNLISASFGFKSEFWTANRGGFIVGVLPLFDNGRVGFSAPGGIVADDAEAAEALVAVARDFRERKRLRYVELRAQRQRWGDLPTNCEHCTLILDLPPQEDAIWRALSGTLRNEIRRGQKKLTVSWGSSRLNEFYRVYSKNMRDLGTPIRSLRYYTEIASLLRNDVDLVFAEHEGRVVASMFLVAQGTAWQDPWASALREAFPLRPNQLMYWETLREAIRREFKTFDFGRSQWNSGTYAYKLQWGAVPAPLYYQYLLAPGEAVPSFAQQTQNLQWASNVWRKLPLPVTRGLGDLVRRHLTEVL